MKAKKNLNGFVLFPGFAIWSSCLTCNESIKLELVDERKWHTEIVSVTPSALGVCAVRVRRKELFERQ